MPKAATPKKTATKKASPAKKKAATHPTYQVMVQESIKALKERKGASRQALKKYIEANYKCEVRNYNLNSALKKLTEDKVLEHSETGQRWKFKKAEAKPAAKKPAAKKVAKPAAKKAPAKKATKKPAAKKPAAKKAAKKPAAKKAKK